MTREHQRQLNWRDRIRFETLMQQEKPKTEIARLMNVCLTTVYNEEKRGMYEHLNSDYTTEMRYSADLAQRKFEEGLKKRGRQLKIGNDIRLANYIEKKIAEEGYSPEAVIGEMRLTGKDKEFSVTVCTKTVYNYIEKEIFLTVTNKDLPVKGKRKKRKNKSVRVQKRALAGDSIEQRPPEIDNREEFGHWEMDSVVGPQRKAKNTMLTLTERKTRKEIIFKLPDHSASSVVTALDELEKEYGAIFSEIFKTITVDNGTEFSFCYEMEHSCLTDGLRTKIYYCHPYSSWERGSNELQNRMIRRMIPKGTNFDAMSAEEIKAVEDWMNNYPRRTFGFRTAEELFQQELKKIAA